MKLTLPQLEIPKCYVFITFCQDIFHHQGSYQDLHLVNLEEFKYGGTNVTAFRMVIIAKMTRTIMMTVFMIYLMVISLCYN